MAGEDVIGARLHDSPSLKQTVEGSRPHFFRTLQIPWARMPPPAPMIGSARIGGGFFVDAAQQLPIAEQIAGPHLADRQLAVTPESIEREVGVEADMAGDPG